MSTRPVYDYEIVSGFFWVATANRIFQPFVANKMQQGGKQPGYYAKKLVISSFKYGRLLNMGR